MATLRAPAPPAITLPTSFAAPAAALSTAGAEPAAPAFAAPKSAPQGGLAERWYALVSPLCHGGTLTALARELATQGGLHHIDDSRSPPCWQLLVERETLRTPALRDKLAAALEAALGQPLTLELLAGVPEDSPARRDAAERQRRQSGAEAAIHADPLVRDLLAQFKTARIVPGSIKPV